tara:strand:+ start:1133 stop:2059 length:927 start_codon:yes stop_codon:yes gene_type:complete
MSGPNVPNKPTVSERHTEANESKTRKEIIHSSGIAQGTIEEYIPDYNTAGCEDKWEGNSNCIVVLGRDRDGSWSTGEGRNPKQGTAAISLISGRKTNNPNFSEDAASICISESSFVDRKFDLVVPSAQQKQTSPRSSVGIKADDVRLIGRRTLRIATTGEPTYALQKTLGDISPGASSATGIEIVANNDVDSLQPIVLGDNLVSALEHLVAIIEQLVQIQVAYYTQQNDLNMTMLDHMHYTGFYDNKSLFSDSLVFQGVKTISNHFQDYLNGLVNMLGQYGPLAQFEKDYLKPTGADKYINSTYNKVN